MIDIPEGQRGDWTVRHLDIDQEAAIICGIHADFFNPSGRGAILPGRYTQLLYKGSVIMSDAPDELLDLEEAVDQAMDTCLVAGLGLGIVARQMLDQPLVRSVTVLEKDPDVIALAAPSLAHYGERLEIIQADALTWKPPRARRWHMAWFDIWPDICSDNLPEMALLHRRYRRYVFGWMGSWCRAECRAHKRAGGYGR